jgi:microcystin-dependent protein
MSDPFVGEIEIFGFNFPPVGWALCQGQLLPISQNTALFSILGTTYGGDGKSTFALPNLQGCIPNHAGGSSGQGPGLSLYDLGETGGQAAVTLLSSQMPSHTHTVPVSAVAAKISTPTSANVLGAVGGGRGGGAGTAYGTTTLANMAAQPGGVSGGGQPHNNMAPYLTLNYCIAMRGIFPSRA